jgi:hypothetical protein
MVTVGSHGSWQPGRGPVTTWTASPASREMMARAEQDAAEWKQRFDVLLRRDAQV